MLELGRSCVHVHEYIHPHADIHMVQILTYVRVCFVWTPVRHNIIPGMVVIGRTQVCKGEGESRGNLAKKREV